MHLSAAAGRTPPAHPREPRAFRGAGGAAYALNVNHKYHDSAQHPQTTPYLLEPRVV